MQYLPNIPYPDNEKPKLVLLDRLFREWHQHFASARSGLDREVADGMVFDGFYPHYFNQKKRILFIGREAREIAGYNYLELLYAAYRSGKKIGSQHLNVNKFHSRMLYVAYGLTNGTPINVDSHLENQSGVSLGVPSAMRFPTWKDIPWASEIGNTFGTASGVSFAFMNISKLSNEGEMSAQADWSTINRVHQLSTEGRNFVKEQIDILEPHIIVTMNLGEKIHALGELTLIRSSPVAQTYWLNVSGNRTLLIDTFHFSAWKKDDERDYYNPICDAC